MAQGVSHRTRNSHGALPAIDMMCILNRAGCAGLQLHSAPSKGSVHTMALHSGMSALAGRLKRGTWPMQSASFPHHLSSGLGSSSRCVCHSSRQPVDNNGSSDSDKAVVNSKIYLAVEVAQVLVIFSLLDAGFSGDWSRIGAIPKDWEPPLQTAGLFVVTAHFLVGCYAAYYAKSNGYQWIVPFLKGWAFGAMGLKEVMVNSERPSNE